LETLEEISTHARHSRGGGSIESDFNETGDLWLRMRLSGEFLIMEFQVSSI
jgi:hypothetical protein